MAQSGQLACFAALLRADEMLHQLATSFSQKESPQLKNYIARIRHHLADALGTMQNEVYAGLATQAHAWENGRSPTDDIGAIAVRSAAGESAGKVQQGEKE